MKLDHKLPGEGMQAYRTLAGFAMLCLGRVPQVEDQFVSDRPLVRSCRHGPESCRQTHCLQDRGGTASIA